MSVASLGFSAINSYVFGVISILVNSLLIYVIQKRRSRVIGAYKHMMTACAVFDICFSTVYILASPVSKIYHKKYRISMKCVTDIRSYIRNVSPSDCQWWFSSFVYAIGSDIVGTICTVAVSIYSHTTVSIHFPLSTDLQVNYGLTTE